VSLEFSFDLPPNWQLKTVQELVNEKILEKPLDGNHGGIHPKASDYVEEGIPFIMASDLEAGLINFSSCKHISSQQAGTLRKGFAKEGDVLLSHKATIGRTAIVQPNDNEYIVLTPQVTYYRVKDESKLKNIYLKSYFDSYFFQTILNQWAGSGSTRAYLGITEQLKLPVIVPPIETQVEIASFANNLNSKIHINNQINQTLESIAQAIFKSWFINFEPVRAKIAAKQAGQDPELAAMCAISGKSKADLDQIAEENFAELQATAALFPDELVESELGEVPRGWEVSTIGEQTQTVGGATPSTKNDEFWNNGEHHWTTPKDLSNLTDKILLNTDRKITDAGLKKISSGLLPKDTVLMSSRAPVGYLALAKMEVAINQGYIAILPNTKYSAEYLIQWCEANMSEIKGRASGTTFQEISKKNFREIDFICPDEKIVADYTKIVKPLYDEISSKAKENHNLINLRDTLLPKLLSGEIDLAGFTGDD